MNPTVLPLHFCAAGMRMAGYMLETNLRVARVLNHAAMTANPLMAGAGIKDHGRPSTPRPKASTAPATPRKRATAPKGVANQKVVAKKPVSKDAPARILAPVETAVPAKPAPAPALASTAKPQGPAAPAPRRQRVRAPSTPPAMPAPKSGDVSGKGPSDTSDSGS